MIEKIYKNFCLTRSFKNYEMFFIIAVIYCYYFFGAYNFIADDAYITTVYSKNFAMYGIPDFAPMLNEPVLGYTNFLLMILQVIFLKTSDLDIIVFYKTLGFITGLAILYIIVYFKGKPNAISLIVGLLVAIHPFYTIHANSGMETTLFILLLLLIVNRIFLNKYNLLLVLFMFCLTLVRPEGYIIIFLSVIYIFFTMNNLKKFIIYSTIFAVLTLIYWFFLYKTYGTIIPNTFYVKSGSLMVHDYSVSSLYFILKYFGFLPLLFIIFDFILSFKNKNYFKLYIYILIIILSFFYFFADTEIMGFGLRFYFPILILFFVAIILIENFRLKNILIPSFMILNFIFIDKTSLTNERQFLVEQYGTGLKEAHISIGKDLNLIFPNNKSDFIAVFNDAGAIPYYSSLNTIDAGFLNNKHLTEYKNSIGGIDLNYILEKKPIAIVLTEKENLISFPEGVLLNSSIFFKDNYTLYKSYPFFSGIYEHLFLRNDMYLLKKE